MSWQQRGGKTKEKKEPAIVRITREITADVKKVLATRSVYVKLRPYGDNKNDMPGLLEEFGGHYWACVLGSKIAYKKVIDEEGYVENKFAIAKNIADLAKYHPPPNKAVTILQQYDRYINDWLEHHPEETFRVDRTDVEQGTHVKIAAGYTTALSVLKSLAKTANPNRELKRERGALLFFLTDWRKKAINIYKKTTEEEARGLACEKAKCPAKLALNEIQNCGIVGRCGITNNEVVRLDELLNSEKKQKEKEEGKCK